MYNATTSKTMCTKSLFAPMSQIQNRAPTALAFINLGLYHGPAHPLIERTG